MSRLCPLCKTEVKTGVFSIPLDCGHLVHSKCMDQDNLNFETCVEGCKGPRAARKEEENGYQGRDYIESPMPQGMFSAIRDTFKGNPLLKLLQEGPEKMPIQSLIHDQNYGLHRMLHDGIHIEDFLTNGYTWNDLKVFRDCQTRLPKTLWALGCTAEHLRDHSHALPVIEMGITPRNIVEDLGFIWEDDKDQPTVVDGNNSKPWSARQLADLGMDFNSLLGANLKYIEQYASLGSNDDDDARLGVTVETLYQLMDRPVKQPTVIRVEQRHAILVEEKEEVPKIVDPRTVFSQHARTMYSPVYVVKNKTTHRLK